VLGAGFPSSSPEQSERQRSQPVEKARFAGGWRLRWSDRGIPVFEPRAEESRVRQDLAVKTYHPQPRQVALTELYEYALRVFAVESIAGFDGGGEKTALLGHRALLGDEEVALVGIKKKDTANRQEDEKNVER